MGGVGENGSSADPTEVFFGWCRRGIIWAGRCCFCGIVFVWFLNCFPHSPSVIESPLFLLFRFVEVFISSYGTFISFVLFAFSFFLFSVFVSTFFLRYGTFCGFSFFLPGILILAGFGRGWFRGFGWGLFAPRFWVHPLLLLVIGVVPSFCRMC